MESSTGGGGGGGPQKGGAAAASSKPNIFQTLKSNMDKSNKHQ